MSINKVVKVEDKQAPMVAEKLGIENEIEVEDEDYPAIDKSAEADVGQTEVSNDDYEGRKHKPEIDGPIDDSQETDEIYADPRDEANLPPAGKNVGDLNANDLGRDDI